MFEYFMAQPKLSWIVPFLRQLYTQDSALYLDLMNGLGVTTILHKEGAKQGHSDSSPIYNLVTLDALKALVAEVESEALEAGATAPPPLADLLVAIMDDTTFYCEERQVEAALKKLETKMAESGGKLNYSKTFIYKRSGLLAPSIRALGVTCIDDSLPPDERGIKQLGVPDGCEAYVQKWFENKLAKTQDFLNKLAERLRPHPQGAKMLLRLSVLPTMNYLTRCLPPSVTVPYMQRFDAMVIECMSKLISATIPDGHPARHQMRLKQSLGGLGLTSVADIAPAAYIASVVDCMPLMRALGRKDIEIQNPEQGTAKVSWLDLWCQTVLDIIKPATPDGPLVIPSNLSVSARRTYSFATVSFLDGMRRLPPESHTVLGQHLEDHPPLAPPPAPTPGRHAAQAKSGPWHLQHKLAMPIHVQDEKDYMASIATDSHRLAQHLSQKTGADGEGWLGTPWLRTLPSKQPIAANTMRTGILIFLGLPDTSVGDQDTLCPCGTTLDAAKTLDHFWACNKHSAVVVHNAIGAAFNDIYATLPGSVAITNEKDGCPAAGCRMDKVITGVSWAQGKRILQDQTISNPRAATHIATACTTANSAANKAHDLKLQRYQHLCNNQLDIFFPVALELFGGVHQTVQKTLEDWAKEVARARGGGTRLINRLLQGWRAHLSVALLKARVEFYSASLLRCLEPGALRRKELYAQSYLGELARLPSAGVRFGSG